MIIQKKYAVLGNPIEHSLSPLIHQVFAEQTGITLSYEKIYVQEGDFKPVAQQLLTNGYCGLNITLPFKEIAPSICHQLTERAHQAKAINTIYQPRAGYYVGDNTDGIGLLTDLQRLSFINKGDHILLLGAGGAVRGIIAPLLAYGCQITLVNRTLSKAENLVKEFEHLGGIKTCSYDQIEQDSTHLIINATSAGLNDSVTALPHIEFDNKTKYYDLYYSTTLTPFLTRVKQQGGTVFSDGLGMLVAQASHAFNLWNGVMPDIVSTIEKIQQDIGHYQAKV